MKTLIADTAELSSGQGIRRRGGASQVIRTRLFELAILLWSAPFGIAILTVFQAVRPPRVVRHALRAWSTGFILAARWILGVRYVVEGRENVPRGPVIYVCNHQSYWESIALTALIPHVNVVSKVEATAIPVFGWGLRHAPMILVHRARLGGNLRRLVREARDTLAEGRSVLIFPEGTRVKPGGRLRYQRGLEALYEAAGVDIVPIAHNAGLFWTDGFKTKKAGVITMRFLPAVAAGRRSSDVLRDLEHVINVEKDRLLLPTATARTTA